MDEPPGEAPTRKVGRRGWRRLCFLGAAAILLVATPLSLSQSPCPDPLHPPEALSLEWWARPIELHGEDRLPWVDADLLDVAAASDSAGVHVVVAGRQGTIIASDDGGRSWRREPVRARPAAVEPPPLVPDPGNVPNQVDPKAIPREKMNPPRPDRPRPQERPQDKSKAPAPSIYPPPATGAFLEWLLPSAHAAMPDKAQTANAPPEAPEAPTTEWPPATEDLIALALESWPAASAHGAAGTEFARKESQWLPGPARPAYTARVLSMSRRPVLCLLSTGDLVPVGSWAQKSPPPRLPLARAVRSTSDGRILAVAGDHLYRLNNGWQPLGRPAPAALRGLHFTDLDNGWVVGDGLVFRTADGGNTWSPSATVAPVLLNAVYFLPDGRGWLVGNDGYVAESTDGGATFLSRTRPRLERPVEASTPIHLPPPWYALTWLGALGLFFVGRSIPAGKEGPTELAVEPAFASDRPLERGDPDVLNLAGLAAGLSRFLRNAATRPPLTLAITGIWGTGKSSLMNLLRADLRSFGFHPVWFNAWHHQKEDSLLASLLQSLRMQAIPAFWRIEGLLFRIHLLLIRGRKHALVLLAMLAMAGLTFAYESASGHKHDFAAGWKLARAWLSFLIDPSQTEPNENLFEGLHLAELGSITVLGVSVLRGLRAFGLNPGTLLASAAGNLKPRDLDAQTSFREKFRAEFCDVTQALGPRKLIIFIDDLDRCQPEQVMEVLESINFLVTSGECFVILGMDRERVVPCVALSFKEIAAELSGSDDDAKARRDYANQYLDKLINIEVPVPSLDAADAERLLAPDAPTLQEAEDPRRWWGLARGFRELVELVRPSFRFWPLALAASVLLAGYGGGRALWKHQPPTVHTEPAVAKADQPSPPPAAMGGLQAPAERSKVALAIEQEIAARRAQTGQLVAAGGGSFPTGVVLLILLAGWMLFLLVQIAQLRPETVVRDSSEFTAALKAWRTLIFKGAATPRALRRFQNRVRFLSMRQRHTPDDRPWWKRTGDWLRRQPPPEPTSELESAPIPEPTLVAMAAIYQTQPELLDTPLTAEKAAAIIPSPPTTVSDPAALAKAPWNAQALAEEVSRHRDQFLYRVRGFRVR